MSEKNVYRVRLLRWGDSSSSGRTVTFKLPDDEDDHPFKGLDVGAKNGQLLEMEIAIYEGEGDVETLGSVKKPRARIRHNLPVINDDVSPHKNDAGRRRAHMENVSRRVIKSGRVGGTSPDTDGESTMPPRRPDAPPAPATTAAADTTPSGTPAGRPFPVEPTPSPTPAKPVDTAPGGGTGSGMGGGNLDSGELDAYASQMGQAAEALAAVAERLDDQTESDQPQFPTAPADADDMLDPGTKAVRRATDLCKAIDKQRAGFFYFMRSRYPEAPKLPPEAGEWSRDAKSTRDRVCVHCEAQNLSELAKDADARRKFEELENEFERHERLR